MREPSIHITKSTFIKLLKKMPPENNLSWVDKLFEAARGNSVDHRSLLVTNKKKAERVIQRVSQPTAEANMLADIIYSSRVKLKHVGAIKIKQSDNQWASVKQLVEVVNQFCEAFNMSQRDGYIKFTEVGLKLMANSRKVNYNYTASWMLQKASWIVSTYKAQKEIEEDTDRRGTQEILDIYKAKVLGITGLPVIITPNDTPQDYTCFIHAREAADKLKVDYETYIDAQFDALSFCNGIPKKEDLGGTKGYDRLIQYLSHNKINLEDVQIKESQEDGYLWDEFKK